MCFFKTIFVELRKDHWEPSCLSGLLRFITGHFNDHWLSQMSNNEESGRKRRPVFALQGVFFCLTFQGKFMLYIRFTRLEVFFTRLLEGMPS